MWVVMRKGAEMGYVKKEGLTRPINQSKSQQAVRKDETFVPTTTGVIPERRVLDAEKDVCEYLYHEGMASLKRCVRLFGCCCCMGVSCLHACVAASI